MKEDRAPTFEDLAYLLEAAAGGKNDARARDALDWLIEDSGTAALRAELTAERGEEPSLLEFARLLCSVGGQQGMPESLPTAHWLIAQSEAASALLDRLERVAADAGTEIKIWNRTSVLDYEQQLQRLLAAADEWQHPDEVLDPIRWDGIDYPALYRLCSAWVERSQGQARCQLETLQARLKRPAELHRLLPRDRRFERLEQWLREISDVDDALDSLEEMAELLRVALEPE